MSDTNSKGRSVTRERNKFADAVLDGKSSAFDLSHKSNSLLIAFAAGHHKFSMRNSDALKLFNKHETNVIFIRDPQKVYTFGGIPELGKDIDSVASTLKSILSENKIENLVIAGTSLGGFLSILYGVLLNAKTVHAFMPTTTVKLSERYRDRFKTVGKRIFWNWRFFRIMYLGRNTPQYIDLQLLLKSHPHFRGKINIYFNQHNKRDIFHAKRMEQFEQVNLITYPGKIHNVIPYLFKSGELENIFADLFTKQKSG